MVFVIGAVALVIVVYVISLISGSASKQVKEQQKEHLKALAKEFNELKEEKVSSFVRVKTLLEVIGATIDKEIKEEGKTDSIILATYQGGYFVFFIDEDQNTIAIRYNNFYRSSVDKYREILMATSATNARFYHWSCSWWYDNENKESLENMHVDLNSYFSLLGPAQKLAMMLKDHLQQVFRISRFFSDEMDRLIKEKLPPISDNLVNRMYFHSKIEYARTALEKGFMHSKVQELPELSPFSLYNTIMLYGMVELGNPRFLRIILDNRVETFLEKDEIINFDVRDYIISKPNARSINDMIFSFGFESKTITFVMNKHQSSTKNSLFFETYLVGIEEANIISNDTCHNMKQLSLLEVRFADAEQDFQEAKYMFSEAQEKLNKNENVTNDERLLLSFTQPSLYEDIYWAKKFYNNKCYYQSLFYFKRVHNFLNEHIINGDVDVYAFCEVTFYIGFIYMELSMPEKAHYYLYSIRNAGNYSYNAEYINCLNALKEPYAVSYIKEELDKLIDEMSKSDEISPAQEHYRQVLMRRYVYSLIEIKNYDTAIEVLRYMIKNEDSVEFAKSELKYVLELKKKERKNKKRRRGKIKN